MLTRVRIIHEGRVTVSTLAFSQLVEMLGGLDEEAKAAFRRGEAVDLPNGDNIKRVARV